MALDAITVTVESPRQPEVVALIAALEAYLGALYAPDERHWLDIEALALPTVRFFVARAGDTAVGCGALRLDAGWGEVKRMYVEPEARRRGVGVALLAAIEGEARRLQLADLRLETGVRQPEAIALYRATGYVECDAFGEYVANGVSVFMEKHLP